jgi:hypothetical protein
MLAEGNLPGWPLVDIGSLELGAGRIAVQFLVVFVNCVEAPGKNKRASYSKERTTYKLSSSWLLLRLWN